LNDLKNVSGRKRGLENNADTGGGGRGHLFTQIVRVLKDVQPNAFLLENVPGLITTEGGKALQTIISSLEEAGYDVSYEICSSRGLTTQSRKRLYIVGIKQISIKRRKTNNGQENCTFQFPFIPDLKMRAADVLHTQEELHLSLTTTGVPVQLAQHFNDKTPASMFQLTDAQMTQLRTRSKSWKPAKLAWDNTTCDTIDSHYGVTVGKVRIIRS
jgi:DNA-cytosine methyltransferase